MICVCLGTCDIPTRAVHTVNRTPSGPLHQTDKCEFVFILCSLLVS